MRLQFLAGNRTGALRQYERCVIALDQELGVKPAKWTTELYDQIRADQLDGSPTRSAETVSARHAAISPSMATHLSSVTLATAGTEVRELVAPRLPEVLSRLKQLQALLADIQQLVLQDVQTVEASLEGPQQPSRS